MLCLSLVAKMISSVNLLEGIYKDFHSNARVVKDRQLRFHKHIHDIGCVKMESLVRMPCSKLHLQYIDNHRVWPFYQLDALEKRSAEVLISHLHVNHPLSAYGMFRSTGCGLFEREYLRDFRLS